MGYYAGFINIIVKTGKFKMNYNLDLYKEFVERKKSRQPERKSTASKQRTEMLRSFLLLSDDQLVNLESSISILRKLFILQRIESTDHIISIVDQKRNSGSNWSGNPRELLECRLIYALWAVIEEESIQMREFKEILLILANEQSQGKADLIREMYGDKEEVEQLIDSWESLTQSRENGGHQHHSQSRQEISDISIIKSKNQGNFESNKENISYFNEEEVNSSRLKTSMSKRGLHAHQGTLEKSFQKRESQTKMQRSRSNGKTYSRKSLSNSLSSTSGARAANFFSSNDNLTPSEEQQLISRLYKYDKYKEREEKKKQIERERIQAEMNECSFKPILDRSRAMSKSKVSCKEVKGYDKAIDRMKSGYKKNQELKENLEYRIWKQPTQEKKVHLYTAPKFLSRVKQAENELFQIVFTIGRHNIRIKIKQSDKISDIVNNIGRIYSLKQDNRNYIRSIIEEQLNNYYEAKCQKDLQGEQPPYEQ